ncbi:hypothetical protein ASU28_06665 [Lactiplantibacillus paraplantarum]|nr:hypothetical protein ASU28_06665 [Lactiplantibacillus paraplantarum]OAX74493.1 hypothetical protein A0U96_00840 [Lactiplantibacillus plantarum]RKD23468.1 hypothetical protein BG617_04715 [Lactiplantibacillus paraplantarum]
MFEVANMQNQQSNLKLISKNLHASYRQFMDDFTAAPTVIAPLLPMMPAFQRDLFLTQARMEHYQIMLQMQPQLTESHPYNIHGVLKILTSGQLVLINRQQHLTHLVDPNAIRYIKRV